MQRTLKRTNALKKDLLSLLYCPDCQNSLTDKGVDGLVCEKCGHRVKVVNGIPMFTDEPQSIEPWQKVERGPDKGTAWRRSNWKFLEQQVKQIPAGAAILDVGAGHGDFADIFEGRNYFALDIVPYPEVDLVTDLVQVNPFRPDSFDVVVLINLLDNVYESRDLLKITASILKPSGVIIITVPFLLKVHQAPFDFARYTPYSLEKMAEGAGLHVEKIDGYYNSLYLLNESLGNLWQYSVSSQSRAKQVVAKSLIFIIQKLINGLVHFIQPGYSSPAQSRQNPAPVGYLVILRK
jgi:SAM-dependent methyltransferase